MPDPAGWTGFEHPVVEGEEERVVGIRGFRAEMRILAFITDFATARAIRRSLKLPAQEPEPLAHGPPHEIELLDQIA